jgi:DNA-directed RNA polymerase subunit RPC12/RpoP
MSGGHYDYIYSPVQAMAEQIENEAENWKQGGEIPCPECNGTRMVKGRTCLCCLNTPLGQPGKVQVDGSTFPKEQIPARKKIASILTRVSEAMRALEWYDSGDSGDWEKVITAFEKVLELDQP